MRARLEHGRSRDDTRQWMQDRRARTRQLIELGGLVQKVGQVDMMDDDRAMLFGALLELADRMRGPGHAEEDPVHLRARWQHRDRRAFEADRQPEPTASEAGYGHAGG